MSTGSKLTGTVAQKYKALGAGNGFPFCRAKAPTDEADKPTSIDTLKKSMAWYWLLEDIELILEIQHTGQDIDGNILTYKSSLTLGLEDFIPIDTNHGTESWHQPPKDRAVFNDEQRSMFSDGSFTDDNNYDQYATPAISGFDGNINYDIGSGGFGFFFALVDITWYDDDTAAVTFVVTNGYDRFILTNLPTTSDLFTEANPFDQLGNYTRHFSYTSVTPVSLGSVSTEFGTLTGYDVSLHDGGAGDNGVTKFTFNHKFFTFS